MSVQLEKIKHYCAWQERCHSEVRHKLLEMKVYGDELEQYMSILIEENFLNEERFACAYAGGKFRIKQWGRNRIRHQLRAKQISAYLIQKAMNEIDDDDYMQVLMSLAQKKMDSLARENNAFVRMQKTSNFLLQRGFEADLVADVIKRIQPED